MALVIELIEALPEHFKLEHLAGILAGVPNAMIKSYHHDKLSLYGAGKDHDVRFWAAVIHQGLILHFLDKDIENYGLISVTEEGRKFYEHPYETTKTMTFRALRTAVAAETLSYWPCSRT